MLDYSFMQNFVQYLFRKYYAGRWSIHQ